MPPSVVNTSNTVTLPLICGNAYLVLKSIPAVESRFTVVASGFIKYGKVTPVKFTLKAPPCVMINLTLSNPVFLKPVNVSVVDPEVVKVNTEPLLTSIELDPDTDPNALTLPTF